MNKISIIISILCSIILSSRNDILLSYMNDNSEWIYKNTDDDIEIYQLINDANISMIKLVKEVESTKNIFNVILNLSDYNNVLSNNKIYTEEVKTDSDTLYGYQEVSNLIPFLKNRQVIFQLFRTNNQRLDWKLLNIDNKLFSKYQFNRYKTLTYGAGSWQIVKHDTKETLVHYYYINPELKLPHFIIDKAAMNSVIQIFKDVLYTAQFY